MTFMALLVLLQVDPLAKSATVQVTGWSPDETRFSVRAFDLDDGGEGPECDGYVDHQGKKFQGRLVVAAYERGKLLESWVVQDYPECTDAAKAKATLTAAKAKFQELGIDLDLKGAAVPCAKGCDVGHGSQIVVESSPKKSTDDAVGYLKGSWRVVLSTAKGSKTTLLEKKVKEEFGLMMGGNLTASFGPVERSPQGGAFVTRASLDFTSGRGGSSKILPIGYFAWTGERWEKGAVPKSYIEAPAPK